MYYDRKQNCPVSNARCLPPKRSSWPFFPVFLNPSHSYPFSSILVSRWVTKCHFIIWSQRVILGTFGHFFFDHDHDKNGPGRSALLWCVFGLAPPYNWQVDIFPFSCETPDKCQKCEASREYWETMICDIFWNWVIGKVKMYSFITTRLPKIRNII